MSFSFKSSSVRHDFVSQFNFNPFIDCCGQIFQAVQSYQKELQLKIKTNILHDFCLTERVKKNYSSVNRRVFCLHLSANGDTIGTLTLTPVQSVQVC